MIEREILANRFASRKIVSVTLVQIRTCEQRAGATVVQPRFNQRKGKKRKGNVKESKDVFEYEYAIACAFGFDFGSMFGRGGQLSGGSLGGLSGMRISEKIG